MTQVIGNDELPNSGTDGSEGCRHGGANISFFLSEAPPGSNPELHTHPYEEVFVVQEGGLTFTVGNDIIEVGA